MTLIRSLSVRRPQRPVEVNASPLRKPAIAELERLMTTEDKKMGERELFWDVVDYVSVQKLPRGSDAARAAEYIGHHFSGWGDGVQAMSLKLAGKDVIVVRSDMDPILPYKGM